MTVPVQVNIITPGLHPDGSRHRRLIISMASFLSGKWRRYWVIEWLAWLVLFDCQMIWFYPQMTISTSPLVEEIILWTSSKDLPFNWMPFHSRTWSPVDWFRERKWKVIRREQQSLTSKENEKYLLELLRECRQHLPVIFPSQKLQFHHVDWRFPVHRPLSFPIRCLPSQIDRSSAFLRFACCVLVLEVKRRETRHKWHNQTGNWTIWIRNDQTCSGARFGITSE